MAETTLFFGLLFLSIFISGSGEKLLVQEAGTSVQMQILEPNFSTSSFDELYWKFNKNKIIIFDQEDVEKYGDFKDRMEFNKETCMLTLNNLKKTDSGLYEAIASADTDRSVAKYTLSVMVEAPVLTVYNSTDPCNITLTCRGHDLSITSTCYNETCEEKEVTSPGGVTLSLSVRDGAIICNHSNLVSWKQEYKTLTHLCADKGTEPPEPPSGSHWTGIPITVCFLVILVLLVVGCYMIKRRRSAEQRLNTREETSEQPSPCETREEPVNPQHPASNGASGH